MERVAGEKEAANNLLNLLPPRPDLSYAEENECMDGKHVNPTETKSNFSLLSRHANAAMQLDGSGFNSEISLTHLANLQQTVFNQPSFFSTDSITNQLLL